ncbi:hypothetical protein [Lacihabitans soyangensis]|uniref:hypothetical protein n=1 Tax=Lacihabitans soyangensis TaxID=869394 RepID=UPI0020CCD340|nr:hypothetical protein [Lacihabitans soyangensis]
MKKSIALIAVLVGLSMSSFAADSPLNRERKKSRKMKSSACCTEMSKQECKAVCTKEEQKSCMKK